MDGENENDEMNWTLCELIRTARLIIVGKFDSNAKKYSEITNLHGVVYNNLLHLANK